MSFGVAAAIVIAATFAIIVTAQRVSVPAPPTAHDSEPSTPVRQVTARALSWALPLAPWVFASPHLGSSRSLPGYTSGSLPPWRRA